MDNLIAKIYQLPKTVLTNKDLALVWQETNQNNLKAKIAYYIKQGALLKITRGVFAKDKNYSKRELATSLYSPSYISFETVLRDSGVIFQHHETIFAAGRWTKQIEIDGHNFSFRKLKDELLFNSMGIIFKDDYNMASQERAFLDTIYLFPEYYFDNLSGINWEKCFELVKIYKNQQMIKRLGKYQKNYAQ